MNIPDNNKELYDYLHSLSQNLELRGKADVSKQVKQAIRSAATLNPIVFMGETRIILQAFIKNNLADFTQQEIMQFKEILTLIEDAFAKHRQRSLDSYKK